MQNEPENSLIARLFEHRIGLARELRLVHFERVAGQHFAIHDEAVARLHRDQVIFDDLANRHGDELTVAPHADFMRRQRRQLIELALGADLLKHAQK